MMKQLVLFFSLFTCLFVQAQKAKTEAYIQQYRELAIEEMMRTGVPAAITLAQGILESQSGESDLARNAHNHFGIKCKTEWTGPKTYHDDDAKGECFRVYASDFESYKDHSDFLKTRPNYAFLFQLDPADYEGWAKGLKKAGYATSPTYPQRLLHLIADYHLQDITLEALARIKSHQPLPNLVSTETLPANTITEKETLTAAVDPGMKTETTVTDSESVSDPVLEPKKESILTKKEEPKNTFRYPTGIFTINHAKVVYACAGTSLLSLAMQYEISLRKLIDFNELPEMELLDKNRLIFLEKKMKKGASDFHLVTPGETLPDIAQQEGIRLENLLAYNHLTKESAITNGEKLLLREVSAKTSSR
jgi:LysM repeat protein